MSSNSKCIWLVPNELLEQELNDLDQGLRQTLLQGAPPCSENNDWLSSVQSAREQFSLIFFAHSPELRTKTTSK